MTTARDPGDTPGESEMGWGPGIMPNPDLEPPHLEHQLMAAHKTNQHSDDPTYVENFEELTDGG